MTAKIFGIGLPKSGTTSLHRAAVILGLSSIHFPEDTTTLRQIRHGDYHLSVMEQCDLICDIPIPAIFPQLDQAFPGSKFILTCRERDSWLASQEKAPFNQDSPAPGSLRDFYRALLYGVTDYSRERFRWVYDDHHAKISRYFAGARAKDLLIMDVTAGDGWEKLCGFLGLAVPEQPFPHENRAKDAVVQTTRSSSWLRKALGRR
jgi:Sulfotransferase domain